MRPLILLSNDDGIDAPGLAVLVEALEPIAEVVVVAPERERSAASHAITLHKPLRPHAIRPGWYALSGTPADCVYVAMLKLLPRPPALILSGINNGHNLGSDVFYSGTLAAAAEGALRGVSAAALSQPYGHSFEPGARFAAALAAGMLENPLPPRTLLNVNLPSAELRGYRWTKLGERVYRDRVDERHDLRGRAYYWIGGPTIDVEDTPTSDGSAVRAGWASVTPLRLDLTAHDLLDPPPPLSVAGYAVG